MDPIEKLGDFPASYVIVLFQRVSLMFSSWKAEGAHVLPLQRSQRSNVNGHNNHGSLADE